MARGEQILRYLQVIVGVSAIFEKMTTINRVFLWFRIVFPAFFFKKFEIATEFRDFAGRNLLVVKFVGFLDYERQNFNAECKFFVHQVFIISCFN